MSLSNKRGQMSPSNTSGNPFVVILIRIEKTMTGEDLVCFPIRAVGLHGADVKDLTRKYIISVLDDVFLNEVRRAAIFLPVGFDLELFLFALDLFRLGGPEKFLADIFFASVFVGEQINESLNVLGISAFWKLIFFSLIYPRVHGYMYISNLVFGWGSTERTELRISFFLAFLLIEWITTTIIEINEIPSDVIGDLAMRTIKIRLHASHDAHVRRLRESSWAGFVPR